MGWTVEVVELSIDILSWITCACQTRPVFQRENAGNCSRSYQFLSIGQLASCLALGHTVLRPNKAARLPPFERSQASIALRLDRAPHLEIARSHVSHRRTD